jgi:hypothetical protein
MLVAMSSRGSIGRLVFAIALTACSRTPAAPAVGAPGSEPAPAPTLAAAATAERDVRGSPPGDAREGAASEAPPPAVERSGKVWPFHAWDRAEAITFNAFAIRPDTPLRAYDERGWSPHVALRKAIDAALAKSAVALVAATEGDVAVSKCPFPRHAVVLYDGDLPVASVNVCFECGDILLWPRWEAEPDWSALSDAQMKAVEAKRARQMKLYEKTFPRWRIFFEKDVGYPTARTYP